jgi:hypothetical protein
MNFSITLLLGMVAAHALCDYPLQGDFLARAKNHRAPLPGVPWYQALFAHALIQAAAVSLLTGSIALGIGEFVMHSAIDYTKSEGSISYNTDQFLHVVSKIVWVWILPFVHF